MQTTHRTITVSCLMLGISVLIGASEVLGALNDPSDVSIAISEPEPSTQCSSHQVIAMLADRSGDCSLPGAPATPSWTRHRMFGDSTPDIAAWTEDVPGELQRFCSYEYVGEAPLDRRAYDELYAAIAAYPQISLASVASDCHREVVQGNDRQTSSVAARLASQHHDAIQWVPASALESTSGHRRFTALAILDTVSQRAQAEPSIEPSDDHGLSMREIAADIACPGGELDCLDAIQQHLALPRSNDGVDWVQGGEFGTMGDLATSIVAAVGHWRMAAQHDPDAPKRLVISASLGWTAGPRADDPNDAPSRALEQALEFAACNGVIVIAAAGNASDPACNADELGPLAPASYELVEAPGAAECARLGYSALDTTDDLPVFGEARPLVYAAGGVDGRGRPIVNARPESMPSLVAHAQLVSVETPEGYTKPLTGTSASTAAIAGIASLVWSYAPALTPAQVMRLIYTSGTDTRLDADFGFAGGSSVHRASVCAALSQACASLPSNHCPELTCSEAPLTRAAGLANVFGSTDPSQLCPSTPWTERITPQPATPPCPMCMIDDDELQLTLDDDYDGLTLENVTIELYDAQQGSEFIDYGDLPLTSSSTYTLTDADLQTVDRSGLPPTTAWIEMEFTDYSNPSAPVTIYAGNELTVQ